MRYAANGWGIQILKNCGIELQPVLKKNGLFCFPLQLTPHASRFTVKKVRVDEISGRENK
jgi:hypothetical protein